MTLLKLSEFVLFSDIWQLLLESPRFCAIGDKIGISEDLPNMYKSADAEVMERTASLALGSPAKPSNRNPPRMNNATDETNMVNAFQLFPQTNPGLRPGVGLPNVVKVFVPSAGPPSAPNAALPSGVLPNAGPDAAPPNFSSDAMGPGPYPWSPPGYLHLRPPPPQPHRDIGSSDFTAINSDKNSSRDGGEPRQFNPYSMDNVLNANLHVKPVPIRNEHKNSVHSISSDDALNDNLGKDADGDVPPGTRAVFGSMGHLQF